MVLRLDKMLAHCGYGSRKEVKQFIRRGEVLVNGEVIKNDDYKVDSDVDDVIVFDESVSYKEKVYIMLNKPQNVVSATYDPHKETVIDLVSEYASYKIFPVGRLDIDTTGLLLITNDGLLCHKMLAPKSHVDKKYYVEFSGEYKQEYALQFKNGITLEDGYVTLPGNIEYLNDNKAIVTIHEGKFHQVKRMFLALNMEVTYLRRITFGPLSIDENLKEGEYRLLTEQEVSMLNKLYE